ncbi:MAG: aminotransferase class III-fold pyridoxal phosphate-dependent enzyme [Thermomicrobiales bacterium]|nr:aminotransferase class III-fold pyridoxal phosphate-dependent enzyme [Thermomicrobiales bacterium]
MSSDAMRKTIEQNIWIHNYDILRAADAIKTPTIVRGEGAKLWDSNGNEYIDALAGLGCVNIGYGRQEIGEAMIEQLNLVSFVNPFRFVSVPGTMLAKRLSDISPTGPDSRVFYVSGGSEAIESALKLAKQYHHRRGEPTRYKTISRRYAYHGTTMGALSINGVGSYRADFGPLVPGARHVPPPYPYRCHLCKNDHGCSLSCADEVERLIQFEGPDTVAAVIMEPIQNAGGPFPAPDGYFQRVREICDRYGVVLIMDEIISGFGRTGLWFGSDHYDLQPDIIATAKGLTSAYAPLGAMIASSKIANVFADEGSSPFRHGFTYGGHVISTAAAIVNLDIIEREGLVERAASTGKYLRKQLDIKLGDHPNVGEIRGVGLQLGIELVRNRQTKESMRDTKLAGWLTDEMFSRGIIGNADTRGELVIPICPPLNIELEEIDRIVDVLVEVIDLAAKKSHA